MQIKNSPLGKHSTYIDKYDKSLLFTLPRKDKRHEINISATPPFTGYDIWNAYEVSWLNMKGKPCVALAEFIIPCESKNIIESKSLKLYLNSFNNTKFISTKIVQETLSNDISQAVGSKDVEIRLAEPTAAKIILQNNFTGQNIDKIDITCDNYYPDKQILTTEEERVEETLCSNLLKSNCPVTGQPDWASLLIHYCGKKLNHANLLKYIVSFRNHAEFHEHCVEKIFMDIMRKCNPKNLTIYARYTRRGGIDINPLRTNQKNLQIENLRLARQ